SVDDLTLKCSISNSTSSGHSQGGPSKSSMASDEGTDVLMIRRRRWGNRVTACRSPTPVIRRHPRTSRNVIVSPQRAEARPMRARSVRSMSSKRRLVNSGHDSTMVMRELSVVGHCQRVSERFKTWRRILYVLPQWMSNSTSSEHFQGGPPKSSMMGDE